MLMVGIALQSVVQVVHRCFCLWLCMSRCICDTGDGGGLEVDVNVEVEVMVDLKSCGCDGRRRFDVTVAVGCGFEVLNVT